MSDAFLIDTTRCIGCRACQVACKKQNNLPPEKTEFFAEPGGYQNPSALSSRTFSLVTFREDLQPDGGLKWVFAKHQCMHCLEPSCASACIVGALIKTEQGPVIYDNTKCIGCRYCQYACPFGVPGLEWEKTIPFIRKCTLCADRRADKEYPDELNERPLSDKEKRVHSRSRRIPACAKSCGTGAIMFGDRDELLAEAKARISADPKKYINHIYGEHEVGGTSALYLASVPFEKLGFPTNIGNRPYPSYTHVARNSIPYVIFGVGGLFSGIYWLTQRMKEVEESKDGKDQ